MTLGENRWRVTATSSGGGGGGRACATDVHRQTHPFFPRYVSTEGKKRTLYAHCPLPSPFSLPFLFDRLVELISTQCGVCVNRLIDKSKKGYGALNVCVYL